MTAGALTRGQRAVLWLIVLLPACLRCHGIGNGLLGRDEWRETETATIARNFLDEPDLLHPRINWGAPGPGYVESELQLLPYLVHLLYRVAGPQPWLGRAFAVLLSALSCRLLYRLARRGLEPGRRCWPMVNNFEVPKVLFHAWRCGRLLPADDLQEPAPDAAIARAGAVFVVVIDSVMVGASAEFRAAIAAMPVVRRGDGFAVHRVRR